MNTKLLFYEGEIETGYKYWINTSLIKNFDSIDTNTYPYPEYWPSQFFDTREARDKAFDLLTNHFKYKRYE